VLRQCWARMKHMTKCLLHMTCRVQGATFGVDWEGGTRCRWWGYSRAINVHVVVVGDGSGGREIVMYVLWGECWQKVEIEK